MKITISPAKTGNKEETIIFTFPPCCNWFWLFSWVSFRLSHPLYSSYLLWNLLASGCRIFLTHQMKPLSDEDKSINQRQLRSLLVNYHNQISLQFEAGWISHFSCQCFISGIRAKKPEPKVCEGWWWHASVSETTCLKEQRVPKGVSYV